MLHTLFITGASGFIGNRLIQSIDSSKYQRVYCLCRNKNNIPLALRANGKFHVIKAGIEDCDAYRSYLAESDTVIHLASATGKTTKEEYFDVNARGTKIFLEQCKDAGTRNFLHVSTIAVKYPDKSRYYYAQSKEQGEKAVNASGLRFTIVRPTIVIGENGGLWNNLVKLAKVPVIPLFGDGTTKIQPIHVDDLVGILLNILNGSVFENKTYELGGPEKISFEAFLRKIHFSYFKKEPSVIRLPIKLLKTFLSFIEDRFNNTLPITTGQLAAFVNDGTIQMNELHCQEVSSMKDVQEMIECVIFQERVNARERVLKAECNIFTNYLVQREPSGYILQKYIEAHETSNLFSESTTSSFEKILLNLTTRYPKAVKLVDSYSAVYLKGSLFRKKIILLMAILENCSPAYSDFETPDYDNNLVLLLKLFYQGISFAVSLSVSSIILLPLQISTALVSKIKE